jgi:hypothetical protein
VARRIGIWACFGVVAVLAVPLLGCSGDEAATTETTETRPTPAEPVDGSFVGRLSRGGGFVAVVAAPAAAGEEERDVEVFVVDGSSVSEWFSGPISGNAFVAKSTDGDGEARGKLTANTVTGTVELSDGDEVRYTARRPGGAAGLYGLSVTPAGKLEGASAAGLGVRGAIRLDEGTGTLRLADGRRLRFEVAEGSAGGLARLRPGEVWVIVLADGELRGAGKSRQSDDDGGSGFFVRSRESDA